MTRSNHVIRWAVTTALAVIATPLAAAPAQHDRGPPMAAIANDKTRPGPNGPTNPPPPQRKWASPFERCKSQDGGKSGWVSEGDGGRRCEYDMANPVKAAPMSKQ